MPWQTYFLIILDSSIYFWTTSLERPLLKHVLSSRTSAILCTCGACSSFYDWASGNRKGSIYGAATNSLGAFLQSNWKVFNHGTLKNHIQWVRWRASRSLPIGDKMAYPRRRITFSVQLGVPVKHRHMQKVPNWWAWKILSVPAPDHIKGGVFCKKKSLKIQLIFFLFFTFRGP